MLWHLQRALSEPAALVAADTQAPLRSLIELARHLGITGVADKGFGSAFTANHMRPLVKFVLVRLILIPFYILIGYLLGRAWMHP